MERENKKRGRGEEKNEGKNKRMDVKGKGTMMKQETFSGYFEDSDMFNTTDTCRPLGVFEFPWQKDSSIVVSETTGWDFRDVFFCSLVDGCSAKVGFPGDRLCRVPAPISVPYESFEDGSWLSEDEIDGVDCSIRNRKAVLSPQSTKVSSNA